MSSRSSNSNYESEDDDSQNESPQHLPDQDLVNPIASTEPPQTKIDYFCAEYQGKKGPSKIPLNAFSLFKEEHFDTIKLHNPQLTHMELIDLIAQKWGESDKSIREEYQRKYLDRKQNFPKFVPARAALPETTEPSTMNWSVKKSTPVTKKPEQETPQETPKKPVTAFFQFKAEQLAQVKAQNPTASEPEITTIIAVKWNNLDAKQKGLYENKVTEAKEKYEKDLKEYEKLAQNQQSSKKRDWTDSNLKAEKNLEHTPKKATPVANTTPSRWSKVLSYFGLSNSKSK